MTQSSTNFKTPLWQVHFNIKGYFWNIVQGFQMDKGVVTKIYRTVVLRRR